VLGIVSTVLGMYENEMSKYGFTIRVYGFTIRIYEFTIRVDVSSHMEQSYPTKVLCIVLNLQKLWNETKIRKTSSRI
jgi:hypothetical protein